MPVRGERPDEGERARDFRRDGDDADIGPGGRNLVQDRLTGKVALEPWPRGQHADTRGVARRDTAG